MNKDKMQGALLLVIPVLIVAGFVLRNEKVWFGVDVVAILIAGSIGLSLLTKTN